MASSRQSQIDQYFMTKRPTQSHTKPTPVPTTSDGLHASSRAKGANENAGEASNDRRSQKRTLPVSFAQDAPEEAYCDETEYAAKKRTLPASFAAQKQADENGLDNRFDFPYRQKPKFAEVDRSRLKNQENEEASKYIAALKAKNEAKEKSGSETIELSREQKHILEVVCTERKSIFFTGAAGVGKSLLLREIITRLKHIWRNAVDAVQITASTGIAGCNIGGSTLHSFSGGGLLKGNIEEIIVRIDRNKKAKLRWKQTQVLIIDEISMVDGEMFDKLEYIARQIRKINEPFGGIQVILCGDFFQLPPVSEKGQPEKSFCFEAECWKHVVQRTFRLTKVFRQKDEEFVKLLNELRVNNLSQESIRKLQSLDRPIHNEVIEPTELYPLRFQVEKANNARLYAIKKPMRQYVSSHFLKHEQEWLVKRFQTLKSSIPEEIVLKAGAQVMLTVNLDFDRGLVNGTIGIVHEINELSGNPIVQFFPNIAAKDPNNLGVLVEIQRHEYKIEEFDEVLATVSQVPLILAWAMSIHKSQGQTIPLLKVDLGRSFEKGQVYVALSRATSLDNLQISNFRADKVLTHPKVIKFNESLEVHC